MLNYCKKVFFFLIHLFARDVLVMKKLEIEKTKPTFIPVLKVKHEVVLVSSISNYFNETSLANKWMSFSCSNLALTELFLVVFFFNLRLLLPTESSVIHIFLLPNHFLLFEIKAISAFLSRTVLFRLNSSHTYMSGSVDTEWGSGELILIDMRQCRVDLPPL